MDLHLPAKDPCFDLAKAVCSHGLFMMAPNHWDPLTRTLSRPLRLSSPTTSAAVASVTVRISQPASFPHPLLVSVSGATSISPHEQDAILAQTRRMLRISDENDRRIREFHELHIEANAKGFGRVFRSPTLFEDMVKCILLCNCQWPRTLSMAKALCEFQPESECHPACKSFYPKTPQPKEQGKKRRRNVKIAMKLEKKLEEKNADLSGNPNSLDTGEAKENFSFAPILSSQRTDGSILEDETAVDSISDRSGNFPSPEELAVVDANYLAKHCKLGYRAERIVTLAKDIVEHKIQYKKLEQICDGSALLTYEGLDKELSNISGFGPFTCANVLMCMGFYHKIPADTETLRHLKQFHRRNNCTTRRIESDLDEIYGKYAPFQFLAYWFELWAYYEERFGEMVNMSSSCYSLITKCNMKDEVSKKRKREKQPA